MLGIDLFSGAGGMSTGALTCGIDVRYAVESDETAAATFALNHMKTTLFNRDIKKIRGSDFVLPRRVLSIKSRDIAVA